MGVGVQSQLDTIQSTSLSLHDTINNTPDISIIQPEVYQELENNITEATLDLQKKKMNTKHNESKEIKDMEEEEQFIVNEKSSPFGSFQSNSPPSRNLNSFGQSSSNGSDFGSPTGRSPFGAYYSK